MTDNEFQECCKLSKQRPPIMHARGVLNHCRRRPGTKDVCGISGLGKEESTFPGSIPKNNALFITTVLGLKSNSPTLRTFC